MKIDQNPDRLYFVCTLIGACNLIILCAAALALLRVLRAAARDLYNSPRRRLLELDDGVARRNPGKIYALCLACRPWTAQKALLAIVALVAACELRFGLLAFSFCSVYLDHCLFFPSRESIDYLPCYAVHGLEGDDIHP